jgi:hypothetical protein
MKTGLERLVEENIDALKEGLAYIAVGKPATGKGCRCWRMKVIYNETDDLRDFGDINRLIGADPKTILFNTYDSAWVGIEEDGNYKSIKDIANRIKAGYEAGRCRADYSDVAALMPAAMREEHEAEMKERLRVIGELENRIAAYQDAYYNGEATASNLTLTISKTV